MKLMASLGFFVMFLDALNRALGSERISWFPWWVYSIGASLILGWGIYFVLRCEVVENRRGARPCDNRGNRDHKRAEDDCRTIHRRSSDRKPGGTQ